MLCINFQRYGEFLDISFRYNNILSFYYPFLSLIFIRLVQRIYVASVDLYIIYQLLNKYLPTGGILFTSC